MKTIKNLTIKTVEGIALKNLQRFPSMEFGEEGGLQVDIYLLGKKIGTLYNAGDGGCANFTTDGGSENYTKLAKAVFDFLIRVDKDFGPNSQYDWMRKKTSYKNISDDDLLSAAELIEERFYDFKAVQKIFKKGRKSAVILKNGSSVRYLEGNIPDLTMQQVEKFVADRFGQENYSEVTIVKSPDELCIL